MKNNVLYFSEFVKLNESKKLEEERDKIKLILLSNMSEESYTIPVVAKNCVKRGIEHRIIDINTCILEKDPSMKYDLFISDSRNTEKMGINVEDTAIMTRRGVVRSTFTRSVVEDMENHGFFVVNTLESMMVCENKYVTSKILENAGLPTPKMSIIENEDGIEPAIRLAGGKFPVVMKLLSGSQGIGVSIIESEASLKSVLQTLWKLDSKIEILIQEKIDSDHDLRIHVLTRKFNSPKPDKTDSILLGYMRRNRVNKDFRTNHSLGGTVEKTKVTPEQENIAIDCAKAIGCNWAAVDLIVDKKTGKTYVLEVNASPGTQGLKKATGIDVIRDILDFLEDRTNWVRNKRMVGFREVIYVEGIGDIVAKFDTGNGSLSSSLTYDKMKISNNKKTVEWELGDKKFKNDIIDYTNTEVGTEIHSRVIILIDVQFNGKTYHDVHVSLVDRKDKSTKFLVNRKFMERIGCSVSPNKTFVVSKFDEDFDPAKSKGDPHAGIIFKKKGR